MKRYFFALSLMMISGLVCAADQPDVQQKNAPQIELESKKVALERISIKRIMSKRKAFKARIKRSKNFVRAFYCAGGAVTSVALLLVVRYFWNNWSGQQESSVPVNQNPIISGDDVALSLGSRPQELIVRQRGDRTLLILQEPEDRTFLGRAINTAFNGFNFALYSFIAAVLLNLFYYAEGQSFNTIKDLLNEDELWLFGLSFQDIVSNIARLQSSTYAFIKDLSYLASDNDASSLDFVTYFNGDVVVDFASVVHAIEDVIALISESFFELPAKEQQVEGEIDDLMNQLIEQTDLFAEYLESIVNKHEPFDSSALLKQVHLLFRKFSVTITSYASNCGSLMFGKEFARQRKGHQ